jgi:peptidoglycan/LPS O-acetylase OafA/YrhL
MSVAAGTRLAHAEELARGHLPVLDAYRAVAAIAVVATHVGYQTGTTGQGLFGAFLSRMDIGVALFFALSGFLLYRPWAVAQEHRRRGPRVRGYLWRRALRILPAYWVVVVVALVALPENAGASGSTWVANLLLVQIYVPDTLTHGLTQMWSLATEVAFYLLLPVLGQATSRWARRWSPLLCAVVVGGVLVAVNVVWSLVIHTGDSVGLAGFWLPSFTTWFAVGIVLAGLVGHLAAGRSGGRPLRLLLELADQPGACWVLAVGLLLTATTPLAGPRAFEGSATPSQAVVKNLVYGLVVAVVLLPATLGSTRGYFWRTFTWAPLRRLGDISYGVFLWHLVVLSAVLTVTARPIFSGGFWPVFLETLLGSFAVAGTSWVVLERPVLALKGRVAA